MIKVDQRVFRYPEIQLARTYLSPYDDLVDWIAGLSSTAYMRELLEERHGIAGVDAKKRAAEIASHIRLALAYIRQANEGPLEVSFLPLYYAILNLLKLYVIAGHHHAKLATQRWHGAAYDVNAKESQSLATEQITLHRGGAIPLFLETVTGRGVSKQRVLSIGDVLPYLQDVELEYALASNAASRLAAISIESRAAEGGMRLLCRWLGDPGKMPTSRKLRALRHFKQVDANTYQSPIFTPADGGEKYLRRHLLYQPLLGRDGNFYAASPISSMHLDLPEELSIALVFFHMSSIVRYKPQFLDRLAESRWWPTLLAARRHSMMRFLTLVWSFAHQRTLLLAQM